MPNVVQIRRKLAVHKEQKKQTYMQSRYGYGSRSGYEG